MTRAAVVGSGPNGLTAAVVLARAGLDVEVFEAAATIGGGTRSSELTVPGVLHDHCAAIHPFGAASPVFRRLAADLERHGLRWSWPELDIAHPLDGGRAGVFQRSLDATVSGLGADGPAWRRLYAPLAEGAEALVAETLRPILHVPRHPLRLAMFGSRALLPATWVARRWRTQEARALFTGMAAHAIYPLTRPTTASLPLLFGAVGHVWGWPVAVGGTQSITAALAGVLGDHGGRITTGRRISEVGELDADVVMLDLAPGAAADLLGDRMPSRVVHAYRRYRHGPAAFKLDLAVDGGIRWRDESSGRAATVHLGGRLEEVVAAEDEIARGRMPERPFVLVGQQYLADPQRSAGDVHPVWAYCHVPNGYPGDASEAILGQIERFAPGTRERVVGIATRSPAEFAAYNPNFVGGDIATGAADPVQLLFRPRIARDPYATGVDGVYLCSAATPPGAGVHGMCGYHAAQSALRGVA
jgi:phytoene dehydrogenase-like protein